MQMTLHPFSTTNKKKKKRDHRDQRCTQPARWRRKTEEFMTKSMNCQKVARLKDSRRIWINRPHPVLLTLATFDISRFPYSCPHLSEI